jgi:hypothetical protein
MKSNRNYFDEYDARHAAMRVLYNARDEVTDKAARAILGRAINYVRETALALIPYGATTPNKGTDGRRYGRMV